MGVFTWHNGEVPKNLKIKQVYGILFSEDGRTLLRHVENEKENYFSLAGGRPEVYDNGIEGTLRREVLEEVNEGNNVPPYAQVRMAAIIDKVGKLQPDPDNGETYKRLLTSPKRAIELINWGEEGKNQIEEAAKKIQEKFGITLTNFEDSYI